MLQDAAKLVPRVLSLSRGRKREDPGNEVEMLLENDNSFLCSKHYTWVDIPYPLTNHKNT